MADIRVLGIDPSTVSTGWAIMEGNRILAHGTICPSKTMNEQQKVDVVYSIISAIIRQYSPQEVACEDQFCGPNRVTFKTLSRLVGGILLACQHNNVGIHFMSPTHVKSIFTGDGKASKSKMIEQASTLTTDKLCSDEADAIGVATTLILEGKK